MNCSNSFRLTSFFVPTNKTKGQLGERSMPREVEFLPELPKNATGKVLIQALKNR